MCVSKVDVMCVRFFYGIIFRLTFIHPLKIQCLNFCDSYKLTTNGHLGAYWLCSLVLTRHSLVTWCLLDTCLVLKECPLEVTSIALSIQV